MSGPDPGDSRAGASGSADDVPRPGAIGPDVRQLQTIGDVVQFLETYTSEPERTRAIEALDHGSRMALDEMRRLAAVVDAAMESIRSTIQPFQNAVQRGFEARRKHPDHVIDIACSAVLSNSPSMSSEERIEAALAAFQYCRPMRASKVARANLSKSERFSTVAHAMHAIADTWFAHPRLRRILATAIARELRELQPDEFTRLVDRLDRDACAAAARRGHPVRLEAIREGPGASRVLESDSIADAVAAAETASAIRDVAEELRRSDPASAAAVDYLAGDDARGDVAARHGLTDRQVRRAEDRVRSRFEALRRHVE